MDIVDSHCHLFLEEFHEPPESGEAKPARLEPERLEPTRLEKEEGQSVLDGVLERAEAQGVSAIVNVSLDVDTAWAVLEAHKKRPRLHPTAGWHPSNVNRIRESDLEKLLELALKPEMVAFGEIGLDYFRNPKGAEIQKRVFAGLLEAAASSKKPVIIHCRDAFDDLMKIMAPIRSRLAGVVLHCFSGNEEQAARALDLGCHLSFAGPITFPKADSLRAVLKMAPKEAVMIETDAPYLAPAPFRGKRNEPAYLVHHLAMAAKVLEMEPWEAASLTADNARRFFNLPAASA
jgi:TatD DNase family protein